MADREWAFVLHPEERPTAEQSDRFDRADALAGGEVGWEEGPDGVRFPCVVRAPHLAAAVVRAVRRLEGVGVRTVRIEIAPFA